MEELLIYIKALVYLQVQSLPEVEQKAKPEVVLARAGLKYSEISQIVGKTEAAVSKAVSRAK
jgi:DNA-directed RNA polymerase specialized sigma24 family protein